MPRERRRIEDPEPRYPREVPTLRRTLIIIDYDFGTVEHRVFCPPGHGGRIA